jgi:hypothetical protein
MSTEAERKAVNLHAALTSLLNYYKGLAKDCGHDPINGDEAVEMAESALFENRPLADWESDGDAYRKMRVIPGT